MEMIYHAITNQKKSVVAILIPDKDFRAKKITRGREEH